jgi:phthalate 3,4-dioxygenase subunit alpha
MWQPISENETEVYSWFAVDSAAPEEYKRNSYKAYLMCFGSTGMFEQDDVENWVSLTNTAGGSMARRLLLNSRMGLLQNDRPVVEPLPQENFHGPGVAHVGYNEFNQRSLLGLWADHLEMPPVPAPATAVGADSPNGIAPLVQTNRVQAALSPTQAKAETS